MRRLVFSFFPLLVLFAFGNGSASASPAEKIGENATPGDVAVQESGRILISGTSSDNRAFVLGLKDGGAIDGTFGAGGIATGLGASYLGGQLLVQPNQKILVLTSGSGGSSPELSRLEADGRRDVEFAGGGTIEIPGSGRIALQADGKILYAGTDLSCFRMCGLGSSLVRRYNPDGTVDTAFGSDGIARFGTVDDRTSFTDVAIDGSGHILAVEEENVVRFEPDGDLDPTFGTLGTVPLGAFTGQELSYQAGAVYLGGLSGNPPERRFTIRRLSVDGVFDPSYGDDGSATPVVGPDPRAVTMVNRGNGALGVFGERTFGCANGTDCSRGPSIALIGSGGAQENWASGRTAIFELGSGATVSAGAFQADGKALALAGISKTFAEREYSGRIQLVRFGQNGTPDTGFGDGGVVTVPNFRCRGQEARYVGGATRGWWNGTAGGDVVMGTSRGDKVRGRGAADALCGGKGRDRILGQNGPDLMVGGPGRDLLVGGSGNDRIFARDGFRDVIRCGPGRDVAVVDRKDVVRGCEKVRRARRK